MKMIKTANNERHVQVILIENITNPAEYKAHISNPSPNEISSAPIVNKEKWLADEVQQTHIF